MSDMKQAERLADKRNRADVLIKQANRLYAEARNIWDD